MRRHGHDQGGRVRPRDWGARPEREQRDAGGVRSCVSYHHRHRLRWLLSHFLHQVDTWVAPHGASCGRVSWIVAARAVGHRHHAISDCVFLAPAGRARPGRRIQIDGMMAMTMIGGRCRRTVLPGIEPMARHVDVWRCDRLARRWRMWDDMSQLCSPGFSSGGRRCRPRVGRGPDEKGDAGGVRMCRNLGSCEVVRFLDQGYLGGAVGFVWDAGAGWGSSIMISVCIPGRGLRRAIAWRCDWWVRHLGGVGGVGEVCPREHRRHQRSAGHPQSAQKSRARSRRGGCGRRAGWMDGVRSRGQVGDREDWHSRWGGRSVDRVGGTRRQVDGRSSVRERDPGGGTPIIGWVDDVSSVRLLGLSHT